MRVPRSILLGRPIPGPGEPLWLPQDLDEALAWQVEVDSQCPGCGHPVDRAWDPDRINDWVPEVRHCWACAATARKAKQLRDGDTDGVFVITSYDPEGGADGY